MSACITLNGANRWTSIRIDAQAYLMILFFSFASLFLVDSNDPSRLALIAVGF